MARTIIPAHDERVQVEILIPQADKRKKPLRFIAPRFEFLPRDLAEGFGEWVSKILSSDEDGDDGDGQMLTEELMLNYWIEHLDLEDAEALLDLTRGEKKQIWAAWQEESTSTLGESEPSSDS